MAQHPTVGSFLFEYLYSKGIKHAFGIPGDFALPTFRWLQQSQIKLYTLTHEPSVGFAADGYARVHGLGLAVVTYCVGGLNMLNSIACAYAEKSPVIVISGGPSPNERRGDQLIHHKVRTFDTQRRIFEEVTCANTVLMDAETAADEIIRVVETAIAQSRPGYIEVPYDIVDMPIKPPRLRNEPVPQSDKEILDACIEEAAQFINAAKQPVIIADIELYRHNLTDLALDLAKKFNIPIAATLLSKSVISETNPLYIGVYSGSLSEPETQAYVEASDCIIMLGAFITDLFIGMELDRKKSILVTTEKTRIGLHGYEGVLFKDFLESLARSPITPRAAFTNPNPVQDEKPLTDQERSEVLDVESFFRIIGMSMKEGSTVITDTGDALFGAVGLRTTKSANFLSDAYYLSMGFAVPASVGAMVANPQSRAIVIVGDGAFQMTGIEMSTIAKYKLKPIICVINNDGYGTQRHIIDGPFNNIHPWDYTKMTELLRYGKSVRVDTKGGFEKAMKEAVAADEMVFIEAVVPRDSHSLQLKRLGDKLGELRDVEKRKKKA